jgi:hypothetical protein
VTVRSILKISEKYIIDNSPTLLSAVAVTGSVAVAYLTGKATFKAAKLIAEAQHEQDLQEKGHELDTKEKVKLVWMEYIPPAIVLGGTIGCIVTANSISASRMAALAAAYKMSERQFGEYRDKALEKLGIKDEKAMRDEINEERVLRNPPSDDIQVLATEDEVLFLESWTGRYFRSKMHFVKAAENKINQDLIMNRYATLSDFYDQIGLARTAESSEVGWCLENPISLDFTTAMADGGSRPVIVLEYYNRPQPIRDYVENDPGYAGIH